MRSGVKTSLPASIAASAPLRAAFRSTARSSGSSCNRSPQALAAPPHSSGRRRHSGPQLSAFRQRRIVAGIDRVGEKLAFRPGPELTDVFVGLYRLVPERESVFGALLAQAPHVNVSYRVVEMVEFERPARRVGETDRFQRRHQLVLVAEIAAERP